MLKVRLISEFIACSDIAFDMNNPMLLVATIILKDHFMQKCCSLSSNLGLRMIIFFALDLGRNRSEEKTPRLGNMLSTCLFL